MINRPQERKDAKAAIPPADALAHWFVCEHLHRAWDHYAHKRQIDIAGHLLQTYSADLIKGAVKAVYKGAMKSQDYAPYRFFSLAALLEANPRHPQGLSLLDEYVHMQRVASYRNRPALQLARACREDYPSLS
jgi:hypothetical protein